MRVAVIGYGEVGGIFARDLRARQAAAVLGYDIDDAARERLLRDNHSSLAQTAPEAATHAGIVFIAVTAGSVLAACRLWT